MRNVSKKIEPKGPHRAGFISIAGRPNAGKSTLLNALIGEKVAITAHQAQTTRTSIQGVLTTPEAQLGSIPRRVSNRSCLPWD